MTKNHTAKSKWMILNDFMKNESMNIKNKLSYLLNKIKHLNESFHNQKRNSIRINFKSKKEIEISLELKKNLNHWKSNPRIEKKN